MAFFELYPGREVEVADGRATAVVYPMGIRHLKKFSSKIGTVLSALSRVPVPVGAPKERVAGIYAAYAGPLVIEHLLELIEECTKLKFVNEAGEEEQISLDDLPQYDLPALVETWLEESFGEEKKWKPWITATEKLLNKFLKPEKPIKIMEMLSKLSSQADTALTKSSTEEMGTSPTEDGASPSTSSS